MMQELKPFVPQEVCLSCDGCCRYAEPATAWAPVFLFDEVRALTEKDLLPPALFAHAGLHGREAARAHLVPSQNSGAAYLCPCFESASNRCKIYPHRPFDCRLYPFLLTRRQGQIFLCCDHKCPFIRKSLPAAEGKAYVQYLSEFFSLGDVLQWARENPGLVQDYPPEDLEFLQPLPALTRCLYGPASAHPQR